MTRVISFDTLLKRFGTLAAVFRPWAKVAAPVGGLWRSPGRAGGGELPPGRPGPSRRRQLTGGPVLAPLEAWPPCWRGRQHFRRSAGPSSGSLTGQIGAAVCPTWTHFPGGIRSRAKRGGLWRPPGRAGGEELPPWQPGPFRRRQRPGGPVLALLEAPASMLKETAALPAADRARPGGLRGPWAMEAGRPVFPGRFLFVALHKCIFQHFCTISQSLGIKFVYIVP